MVAFFLFLATLFVAYANGANDNFKGVATLYGANVTTYKRAIILATVATLAGCVTSVFVAEALVQVFSGKGLVPDSIAASPTFILAVATGAGGTVILATVLGFPISTTHSLTGALVGAGLVAVGDQLNFGLLGSAFFLPLLASPMLSMLITIPNYKFARLVIKGLGICKHSCICVSPGQFVPVTQYQAGDAAVACCPGTQLRATNQVGMACADAAISVGIAPDCIEKYSGHVFGITVQSLVDGIHYMSAAAVSFARGLNDTPKIVGLLLVVKALDLKISMLAVAVAMAIGGWINAHKVAVTMSKRICQMNDGQALTANLVTAFTVIFASRFGLPVSTTHVSVGAITGVGLVNGTANLGVIGSIAASWLLTLPIAALISATAYHIYAFAI